MTELAERVALTHQRIDAYRGIKSIGGQNGAIVQELGRLARVAPDEALHIADGFDPSLRASALTIIGEKTGDIGPIFEARAIVEGIKELSSKTRARKLSGIAAVANNLDREFALDTARQIGPADFRASTLIYLAEHSSTEESELPDVDLLREAMTALDKSRVQHKGYDYKRIGKLAGEVDLSLSEEAFNRTKNGRDIYSRERGIWRAVKLAINHHNYFLIQSHKGVVIRALSSVLEEEPRRPSYTSTRFDELNPLEDSVTILRWFSRDPETHAQLVDIVDRAAQATESHDRPGQLTLSENPPRLS